MCGEDKEHVGEEEKRIGSRHLGKRMLKLIKGNLVNTMKMRSAESKW